MGQAMDGASAGIRDAGCEAAGFSPLDPALAGDFWVVSNYADVMAAATNPRAFINSAGAPLGNHLARREMTAGLKAIVALGRFEVEPGFVPEYRPSFARGPTSLPVSIAR
ncbi:hypothetical protein MINTM001_03460 [Mycobacterium paraintracellulare]|uniref:hypothetical protein n=1 Tax=Mycobacterium paraintracellulare TaxID=1138383 RepID=UPI0019291AB0|nr:hypothetical protein [Mycobacterium paraintracellulare]BCO39207.1 hypothetical protein MINTM001_03460 [Mycobacterium paraintracellulare]